MSFVELNSLMFIWGEEKKNHGEKHLTYSQYFLLWMKLSCNNKVENHCCINVDSKIFASGVHPD